MSLSLLQLGLSGMATAQGSLATASHNIANANTAGYSRQEAVLATAGGQFGAGGFFGSGAQITTVRRSYDQFLTGALQGLGAQSAADGARSEALSGLDALFADADRGLGAAMDQVFSAFGDVANRPADSAARQVALARIDQMATRFRSVGGQLDALNAQAEARLSSDADQANQQLATLRQLNVEIQRVAAGGQPPNDLLDQRDAAVQALGQLLAVKVVHAQDGSVNLFTAQGAPLLVGTSASRLAVAPMPAGAGTPGRLGLQLQVAGTPQWLDANALGGGSLGGTLAFRDQDLTSVATQVDALARGMADALNAQHALGLDANGVAGQPLLAYDATATTPPGLAMSLRATGLTPAQLATGDAAAPSPSSDNRNALALQALARQPLAGHPDASEAYASLVGEVGPRVQAGRDQASVSGRLTVEAQARKEAVSGVNLDEEAAALLRHQQAYQASARVLQASQSLFDALMSATGR